MSETQSALNIDPFTGQPRVVPAAEASQNAPAQTATPETPSVSDAEQRRQAELAKLEEERQMLQKLNDEFERGQEEAKEDKEDVDARSIYVGNVEYAATPKDLETHFKPCGPINRVSIMVDKFTGNPKGFAYIEFAEPSIVAQALLLNDSEFFGRMLKVLPKRTNVPGMSSRGRGRGRGRGGYRGRGYRGGYRGRGNYYPY